MCEKYYTRRRPRSGGSDPVRRRRSPDAADCGVRAGRIDRTGRTDRPGRSQTRPDRPGGSTDSTDADGDDCGGCDGPDRRRDPDCNDPPATTAYRWLRVAKVLLGVVVSLLTALKLLGALP